MSHGKEAARDLRYGRRGGGWVPAGTEPVTYRTCAVCGQPMAVSDTDRHATCAPDEVAAPDELFTVSE